MERGRFIQVRITLESEAFFDFVRLNSLWIETSPPLAQQVVGEVARIDDPEPARGITVVGLGEMNTFSYDISAEFSSTSQSGFDVVHINTGARPKFERLEIGAPLAPVDPAEVIETPNGLTVRLPRRISRTNSEPLRVVFSSEVFLFANSFAGQVTDSASDDLPQTIEEGDVVPEVGTNSLEVRGLAGGAGQVLNDLDFSTGVLTPNGDGSNDVLDIGYTLFRLPAAIPVAINVYDLSGRRAVHRNIGLQNAGPQQLTWDGLDQDGQLLPAGLYLVEIALEAESETFRHIRPIGVAY